MDMWMRKGMNGFPIRIRVAGRLTSTGTFSTRTALIPIFGLTERFITGTTTSPRGQPMSVILECQPGDEFVCIQEFHCSPDGEAFSWDTSRRFRVGERLRY